MHLLNINKRKNDPVNISDISSKVFLRSDQGQIIFLTERSAVTLLAEDNDRAKPVIVSETRAESRAPEHR